jgi:hypothetical protein
MASCGSTKHPYCAECFVETWNGDYEAFAKWLDSEHNQPHVPAWFLAVCVLAVVAAGACLLWLMFAMTGK